MILFYVERKIYKQQIRSSVEAVVSSSPLECGLLKNYTFMESYFNVFIAYKISIRLSLSRLYIILFRKFSTKYTGSRFALFK
jgi:hypothetical protein